MLPASWIASIDQLRRDVTMVARGLRGVHPSPLVTRITRAGRGAYVTVSPPTLANAPSTLLAPRTLRIARVVRETADAVSVDLEDPTGAPIVFRPGQFFTVLVTLDGESHRRAYSVASDCRDTSRVTIAVKRVAGGRVSNHVNDAWIEGQSVQVLGPSGSFGVEHVERVEAGAPARHVALLAGGSGITPMMAIARAVLAHEPQSRVSLLYGNRTEADIVFRNAIDALISEYGERLRVRHVLEDAPEAWTGGRGRLARDVVRAELDAWALEATAEHFVCGPEPMMREVRAALLQRGVPEARIHEERFSSPHLRAPRLEDTALAPHILTIRRKGETRAIAVAPAQTVLEAGLAAGIDLPYSCAMGGCAACKVHVSEGELEMEEPNCLTMRERDDGYVLACVARVKRAAVIDVPPQPGEVA